MDKLNRLKWIPMLVRAYSDARVQRELELRSNPPTPDEGGVQSPTASDSNGSSSASRRIRRRRRPVQPARQQPSQHFASRHSKRPAAMAAARTTSMNAGNGAAWKRNQNDTYKSVLIELRETKRKLNRLESIHNQLTEMQQNLDEKLLDLTRRLETRPSEPAPEQGITTFMNEQR